MELISSLRPSGKNKVIDLVRSAGVNVEDWANVRGGVAKAPSNPKYCYQWAFYEPGKVVVLCLWHEQLQEQNGTIVQTLNMRDIAEDRLPAPRTPSVRARAREMDRLVREAWGSGLEVRVILCDGLRRSADDPDPNAKASQVKLRELDPEPWSVIKYDLQTGLFTLKRGSLPDGPDRNTDIIEVALIERRTDISSTTRKALIDARRGQGLYRARLEHLERSCRVTGVTCRDHLRASHSKPWRDSTDLEKLDGANGFLLAPHVDHLYDLGYITFAADGTILVSPELPGTIAELWQLDLKKNVGAFTPEQEPYLAYHRTHVFRG